MPVCRTFISSMLTTGKKIILVFLGILVLAVAGWQLYKYRWLDKKLQTVTDKTKGLYDIQYGSISLDEVSGTLHVKDITITPDTMVYRRMETEKRNPSILLRATIPQLDILGVKTPKALLNKKIEGRSITITNPSIEILTNRKHKDTQVHDPSKDLSSQLLEKFTKISIDSVAVLHGNILVRDIDEKTPKVQGRDISCSLTDLLIDSISVKDSSRILFSRTLGIASKDIMLPSGDKKYKLGIHEVAFTSRNNVLSVGKFQLTPQLPEDAFARSYAYSKDRYDFTLENIKLIGIDRKNAWRKILEADSLIIGKSSFKIYRDLTRPHDTLSRVGKYPQQQLMQVPIPLNIRKVVFEHAFIEYKERGAKSDSAGKLQFYNVATTISNVTNMRQAIARDDKCILQFRSKLLNIAPVSARIVMLLHDPHGRFSIEGDIGSIDTKDLNPLIQPMGLARMEKGHIDHLHFNFKGDDSSAAGPLTMLYRDIKITLLKKDKDEPKFNKKGIPTLLANVIIKKDNPKKNDDPRTVDVHFDRIRNKSFFNLIWKSIFTGIKQSVGMK